MAGWVKDEDMRPDSEPGPILASKAGRPAREPEALAPSAVSLFSSATRSLNLGADNLAVPPAARIVFSSWSMDRWADTPDHFSTSLVNSAAFFFASSRAFSAAGSTVGGASPMNPETP